MVDLELKAERAMDYPIEQGIMWKVTLTNLKTKRSIDVEYCKGIGNYTLYYGTITREVRSINLQIKKCLSTCPYVVVHLGLTTNEGSLMYKSLLDNDNYKLSKKQWDSRFYIQPPTIKEVVEALASDAEFHDYSFEDFCDCLGYSSDSIKAKGIYDTCRDNYFKLMTLGYDRDEMLKLRENL